MPGLLSSLQLIDEQTAFYFSNASWNLLETFHMAKKRAIQIKAMCRFSELIKKNNTLAISLIIPITFPEL